MPIPMVKSSYMQTARRCCNTPSPSQRIGPLTDDDSTIRHKTCAKCHQTYPATRKFFVYKKSGRYGLDRACRACKSKGAKRAFVVSQMNAADGMRPCTECGIVKPDTAEFFKINPHGNLYGKCKECRAAERRTWYVKNKSRVRPVERVRERGFRELGLEGVWEMYDSQDGLCAYCETPLFGNFHLDHMIPVTRGGESSWQNLAIACPSCNIRKSARTAEEFMEAEKGGTL